MMMGDSWFSSAACRGHAAHSESEWVLSDSELEWNRLKWEQLLFGWWFLCHCHVFNPGGQGSRHWHWFAWSSTLNIWTWSATWTAARAAVAPACFVYMRFSMGIFTGFPWFNACLFLLFPRLRACGQTSRTWTAGWSNHSETWWMRQMPKRWDSFWLGTWKCKSQSSQESITSRVNQFKSQSIQVFMPYYSNFVCAEAEHANGPPYEF